MKKKSASKSAFLNRRVLISFKFCSIGLLLALLVFALYPGGTALAAQGPRQNQPGGFGATPTPAPVTVSLPIDTLDASVPGATVIIKPVVTTEIDASLNYVAFQGDFTFDPTVVSFSPPFVEAAGLTATDYSVLGNVLPGPGSMRTLRVSAVSTGFTPLTGSGTLYNLRMVRVSSTPGATSPLVWAAQPDGFIFYDFDLNSHVPDQDDGLITIACPGTVLENFDGVTAPALPTGWVATNVGGDGVLWVTSTTTPDTAPNDAFIPDQDGVSDKRLETPGIVIDSASAQLSFRNNFNMEYDPPPAEVFWDGGVLEISSPNIFGGAFIDVTDPAVGGSFVSGGYTGEIEGTSSNPLGGRMAWGGNSGGYIDTVVNLGPNVNGQTIKLRFRMGSDSSVAAPGWRIDTISIAGACPSGSPTPTPAPTLTPTPTPTLTPAPTTPTPTPTPMPSPTSTPSATPCGTACETPSPTEPPRSTPTPTPPPPPTPTPTQTPTPTPTPAPSATPHGSPHATPTPRPHATPTPRPPHVTPTPHPPHATPTPMQPIPRPNRAS